MKSSCLKIGLLAGAFMIAVAPTSHANLIGVTTVADLGPASTASWAGLGPAGTLVVSPAAVSDIGGNTITASTSEGSLLRLDEGTDFNGNFSFGDPLLYLSGGGQLTLGFATPVSGGGLQIQSNSLGDFAATITAFGVNGTLLGSVSENGFSDSTEDGSAIFVELRDTTASIARLTLTVGGGAFAVGGPSTGLNTAVPEPATLVLVVTFVLGLALASRNLRLIVRRKTTA